MMFKTKCPNCLHPIQFVDAQTGHAMYCPKCNREFTLEPPRATVLRVLFVTWLLLLAAATTGSVAYTMIPSVRRTMQGAWRSVVGIFSPASPARGR